MGGRTMVAGVGEAPLLPSTLGLGMPATSHMLCASSQQGLCTIIGFL